MSSQSNEIKSQVKSLLEDHRGADNPITSREINEEVNLDSVGSFPSTRAVIREIVMEDEIPIAGTSNGYYIIATEDELADYIDHLDTRMLGIADRKYGVLKAAQGWDGDIEPSDDADIL